ncbi:MAG: hypothetical protein ACXVB9_21655, partial [Bdellovibrionota bacterium]
MQLTAKSFRQALLPLRMRAMAIFAPILLRTESATEETVLFKHRAQRSLQSFVLATGHRQPFRAIYGGIYDLAARQFVRFTLKAQRDVGLNLVEAIYLRRGAGRGELVSGASDLDFFVVLHTVGAQQEVKFLKRFWNRYSVHRNLLPFLGETLMGDRNELEDWLQTGCVRGFETGISWKLLYGKDVLSELPPPAIPDTRDVFSEALKCYWALVQPVLKLQDMDLANESGGASSRTAILLRHGVKAALDLFRLHYAMGKSREEALRIYALSRNDLIDQLPKDIYGNFLEEFRNLLALRAPLFSGPPMEKLSKTIFIAFQCLDGIAARLDLEEGETLMSGSKVLYHSQRSVSDSYSLSVRELFAERILFRHMDFVESCVLSEATAQMYFRLKKTPPMADFQELLTDLRNVSFSLERFNVPMPLSELTFRQMEKTSLLDTPFHSFYSHREEYTDERGEIQARAYPAPVPELPLSMLRKTFSEISFALRMQPAPEQFDHFVEKVVTLILAIRIAVEKGEIVTSMQAALECFARRYPTRHEVLQRQLSAFLPIESTEEIRFWENANSLLDSLQQSNPLRAETLRNTLGSVRATPTQWTSATKTTDLWINL